MNCRGITYVGAPGESPVFCSELLAENVCQDDEGTLYVLQDGRRELLETRRSCWVIGVSYFRVKICVRTHSLEFGKRSRSGLVFLGWLMLLDESRKPFPGVQLCEDNLAWRISRVAHNIIQKSIESVIRRMFLQIKLLSICKWFRNSLFGNGVRLLSSGCSWFWWTLCSWISQAPKMRIVMSFLSHDPITRPQILYVVRLSKHTLHDIELVAKGDGCPEFMITAAFFHGKQPSGQVHINIGELYDKLGLDLYPHTTGAAWFNDRHKQWRKSFQAMGFEDGCIRSAHPWTADQANVADPGWAAFGPLSFQKISWFLKPFSKFVLDP